jgi:hypothetical protein
VLLRERRRSSGESGFTTAGVLLEEGEEEEAPMLCCKLGNPISTAASFSESISGLAVIRAFWTRARDSGDGGRGGGNIFCASRIGMVRILQDDITGAT